MSRHEPIDLRAAINSRAASRISSRLKNRDEEFIGENPVLHVKAPLRKPAHNSGQVQAAPPNSTSQAASNTSFGLDHYEESERSDDRRIISHFVLGSSAMAMGAVVQVFKGRGGKATLATWNKVIVL
jgi:hypothetical protein